eukprot:7130617-Lingulodinium_polyedra.AAC.1
MGTPRKQTEKFSVGPTEVRDSASSPQTISKGAPTTSAISAAPAVKSSPRQLASRSDLNW